MAYRKFSHSRSRRKGRSHGRRRIHKGRSSRGSRTRRISRIRSARGGTRL